MAFFEFSVAIGFSLFALGLLVGAIAPTFGIGGGLLSLGASFFVGSMMAQEAEEGGTILAAVTGAGTILGTSLFIHAGKKQDRKEAIQRIQKERKSTQIRRIDQKQSQDELRTQEKKKLEELRKQNEQLLRELEKAKKNND